MRDFDAEHFNLLLSYFDINPDDFFHDQIIHLMY